MNVYSFPQGGIHFTDPTAPPPAESVVAFLPVLSVLPLVQHSGSKALPLVSGGSSVREGMLIGLAQGPGSAHIHATVPGQVLRMVSWKMAEGLTNEGLVIRLKGSFEQLGKPEERFSWEGLEPKELQQCIVEYGIVEMEGPGRPLGDLFASLATVSQPITLVVRCVFDDPWLVADYVLCRERAAAVAEGSSILGRACGVSHIVYAVSAQEKDVGTRLLAEAQAYDIPASLVLVSSRYPQRNPRELELALRAYERRRGKQDGPVEPALGSLLIQGPATLAAVRDALVLHRPILDRYVAVGGSAVKKPQVMKVRIGTRIGDLFAECGGFTGEPQRIILGSPLSGRRVFEKNLDEPVIKTSYALGALLAKQTGGTVVRSCIGCGSCRAVCPVGLDPEALFKGLVFFKQKQEQHSARFGECHGCGCCDLVCPSRFSLSTAIVNAALGEH
ncbi:MAG: SLBB domain-containing protein [Treponema sp.]|nr:SLBB domain-containing protein [Treponema sp.]